METEGSVTAPGVVPAYGQEGTSPRHHKSHRTRHLEPPVTAGRQTPEATSPVIERSAHLVESQRASHASATGTEAGQEL